MLQRYDLRNADLLVWINGTIEHRDTARISPFDSAVQGGDAVWEGLRLTQGRIFGLIDHLERLRRSAHALAFVSVPNIADLIVAVREALQANEMVDGVHIRLTLTRGVKVTSGMDPRLNASGPTLIVLPEFKPPVYEMGGLRLITSSVRRHSPDTLDPTIHHNNLLTSIMAKVQANVAGVDDALMLDAQGFIAETNATHVFWVRDGLLYTPTAKACPEGITRAAVLRLCSEFDIAYQVGDYPTTALYNADEAFCSGTMGGLAPIVEVDGRAIGSGQPGPTTAHLQIAYQQLGEQEGYPIFVPYV